MKEKFPEVVWPIYKGLSDDLTYQCFHLNRYRELYVKIPQRIELINLVAPVFGAEIQRIFLDGLILGVSRLTDPPQSGQNRQLSIGALIEVISSIAEVELTSELNRAFAETTRLAEPIRKHRNKRLAHRDRIVALGDGAGLGTGFTVEDIVNVLRLCSNVLNAVQLRYANGQTYYLGAIESLKDWPAFLAACRYTLVTRDLIERGKLPSQEIYGHDLWRKYGA